ncbi:PREDICTED: lysosomal Pro-X carboxypeptidase-like [Nelumbo nucifera]|uniref:Lysosomal Pro-X carboxypeptidase-like n=2 Tax=Nelumbo nucifera TaxID=4432 RepID=A0A1U8Q4E5_NELNU|nr:PREDICTED: lysosomal Pro-X carboxypeptidase-like [Nelumbo nucifera]DAD27131.1 TPA_asm: hypothetical protein HUJ06_028599 [Nelumbo nucifera]
MPRLGVIRDTTEVLRGRVAQSSIPSDFKTYFYTQTLDHFNYRPESYTTFQQRYAINSKYWGGGMSGAPIFVYLGEETSMDTDLSAIGFLTDHAPQFNALIVYIEHRYYGQSVPFGEVENASSLGYLSSSQALADYAEIILEIKKNLSANGCPVIVIGCSYGGMLASWFRLKYPHIALGALASSAPILYFDDITPQDGYLSVVSRDFRETSESCYSSILQSWAEIDKVASQPQGLSVLSKRFNTCVPLNNSAELKSYLTFSIYAVAAQYDYPPGSVALICRGFDETPKGTDVLGKIIAGVSAYKGNLRCLNVPSAIGPAGNVNLNQNTAWSWQTCTEMVMPIGGGINATLFPHAQHFDLNAGIEYCKSFYGVSPRPHWITTHFGGHDIKRVLKRFGSNIIFSNGLRDPYSIAGVLGNLSDSLVALTTKNGAHCLDLLPESREPNDPDWLTAQRSSEARIIAQWIAQYKADQAANC